MKNEKKSSKKFIIIFVVVLLIMLCIVGLIFFYESNEKILECSLPTKQLEYASIDVNVDIHYTNKIKKMYATISYEVIGETMKSKIEYLESMLKSYYSSSIKGDSIVFDISRKGNIITINFNIDSESYNSKDFELFDFGESDSNSQNIIEIRESIEKSGGVCVEK